MRTASCLALMCGVLACSHGAPPKQDEPTALHATALLRPSVRRLSVAELSAAASQLVGAPVDLSAALPPDARQNDFSRSLTQSVDATTLKQLDAAAREVATKLDLAAATDAAQLVKTLATRGFRRPPSSLELSELRSLFDVGAAGATFRDGAELVVRALLGSPEFLYETALGAALSDDELGSHLAWLVTGQPPDTELSRAARAGELRDGSARRRQTMRLLAASTSRSLYRRFVTEWLGLERLRGLAKSSSVTEDFPSLREAMLRETDSVIDDAMVTTGGSFEQLFASGYSLVPPELAQLYDIAPTSLGQRVSLSKLGRVGLLQHASFLSTFAHEDGSAPVLRGKAVLQRLLCRELQAPSELGIDLVLPAPDPRSTTRERFAQHSARAACAACHDSLDGVGFVFENFDAIGRFRTEEAEKPIDSRGKLDLDGVSLNLANSVELAQALVASDDFQTCAARQLVRFAAGQSVPEVELDFVQQTRALPSEERGNILGLMLAYVQSDWFAKRTAT